MRAFLAAMICVATGLLPLTGTADTVLAEAPAPGAPWQAPLLTDHPMAGQVWVRGLGLVAPARAVEAMLSADVVLLGETHDNPDHHAIQAWLLDHLVARDRRPAVVFEMMTTDQQDLIDGYLLAAKDADGLAETVQWEARGWPDFAMYAPIVETAIASPGPLLAGNPPGQVVRNLGRRGPDSLNAQARPFYRLDADIPPEVRATMAKDIRAAHCDMLPDGAIPNMVAVQWARDASLARMALRGLSDDAAGMAVVITGNGHARLDRGVPLHLRALDEGLRVVAVAPVEVTEGRETPGAYAAAFGAEKPPFDVMWFTPRAERPDPCDQFRRMMEKKAG